MRQDSSQIEGTAALAPTTNGASVLPATAVGTGRGEASVALPALPSLRLPRTWHVPRALREPRAGRIALGAIVVCVLVMVVYDSGGPTLLTPRSSEIFVSWEAGPLYGLVHGLHPGSAALGYGLSAVILAMLAAYGVALAALRTLSMRMIVACIVAAHALLVLAPPFQLTDMFNYLGYARLGGLHGLNPYTHVIGQEMHDPVFHFATWLNLHSPYGELFTALSYPLAFLPVPVAYWIVKVVTVALSLVFIALVCDCARRLGRDARYAAVLVGLNPIYLVYAVGGFHNDFFMLVPMTAAIALLLARRDRSAGAALMLAVAVKFTAVLLLPFLLVAVRTSARRRAVIVGAVLAAIPLAVMSLALFGLSLPNLSQQGTLLTPFSLPNLFGYAIGIGGGTPTLLRLADVALVAAIVLLVRRRGDWLSHAGWATLALIASLGWLMPWYVIWLLPLAALGSSLRLRRAALVLTVFLVVTFLPSSGKLWGVLHLDPLSGSAGQASQSLQGKLSWYQ
jgi:Glycosyltransferase family 87